MPADVRIELLSEHPEYLPVLKAWFEREWPTYYGLDGPGDAAADLRGYSNVDSLPIGIVALEGDKLCGVAALRVTSIPSMSRLCPWAGAGLVPPNLRRRGTGDLLLAGLEQLAERLGHKRIFCATATSSSLLARRGWRLLERTYHDGENLEVFEKSLVDAP